MKTPQVSVADAEAIIRLLGNVALVEGGIVAQKEFLMNGLSAIIDADAWAWATTFKFDPGEVPLNAGFLTGGFTPRQFSKFQEALEHPGTAMLNARFTSEFEKNKAHTTRLRDQIDLEGKFPDTAVYPIWIEAGVEQVILSIRPSGNEALSHIGVYRRPGRPPFSTRESRITHILLGEVGWLHDAVLPSSLSSGVTSLSPRQRITLNLLLEGQNRRQIAGHLRLSIETVNGYVKDVFRHFKVHSQAALIARFLSGDGGDCP